MMDQPDALFLREMLDAMPFAALVVDADVRIEFANHPAISLVYPPGKPVFRKRGGEIINCIHAGENTEGCGHANSCGDCVVRGSVREAYANGKVTRKRTILELDREGEIIQVPILVTASVFLINGEALCLLLFEDISELLQVQGLLPICAACKKVRDDQNYWHNVENYVSEHVADIQFTHSMCPECITKFCPKIAKKREAAQSGTPIAPDKSEPAAQ